MIGWIILAAVILFVLVLVVRTWQFRPQEEKTVEIEKIPVDEEKIVNDMVSMIQYTYSVSPVIFTEDCNDQITQINPNSLLSSISGGSDMSSMMSGNGGSVFSEMLDDRETLEEQYDVLAGEWPDSYDEAILVLSEPNGISDLLVYSLGLRDNAELKDMLTKLMAGETVEQVGESMEFTYENLMNVSMKVVDASDTYRYNEEYDIYEDMSKDQDYMKEVYDHALDLKIVGIVCAKEGTTSMNLSPGVAYTKELTQYIIEKAQQSEIVKKQMANRDVNVFSGKRFDDESEESGLQFEDMITVDTEMLSSAFGVTISEDDISKMTQGYMTQISNAITTDTSAAQNAFTSTLTTMASDMLSGYIDENYNEMIHCAVMKKSQVDSVVNAYMQSDNCKTLLAKLEADYLVPQDTFVSIYSEILNGMLQGYIGMASTNPEDADPSAFLTTELVAGMVPQLTEMDEIKAASEQISDAMTEAVMQKMILTKVGELSGEVMGSMANAFHVDESAIAGAFQFNLSEEELSRLMETMTASGVEKNADTNLTSLGYQDVDEPTAISFYFSDFDSKEAFVDFIDEYNKKMETFDEEKGKGGG